MSDPDGTTMSAREYVEHIALAFLASPDELCEPGEEGGDLWAVLASACDRLGFDPQDVIDDVLERCGQVRAEREVSA